MAKDEVEVELNLDPVSPQDLEVYEISPYNPEYDQPLVCIDCDKVSVGGVMGDPRRQNVYDVEVEFRPSRKSITLDSFEMYLTSFWNARVTPEAMVKCICRHIHEAIGAPEIYVDVTRKKDNSRQTVSYNRQEKDQFR